MAQSVVTSAMRYLYCWYLLFKEIITGFPLFSLRLSFRIRSTNSSSISRDCITSANNDARIFGRPLRAVSQVKYKYCYRWENATYRLASLWWIADCQITPSLGHCHSHRPQQRTNPHLVCDVWPTDRFETDETARAPEYDCNRCVCVLEATILLPVVSPVTKWIPRFPSRIEDSEFVLICRLYGSLVWQCSSKTSLLRLRLDHFWRRYDQNYARC